MSITYAEIEKANKQLKLTPIKGKDYAEVNQRVKAFRMVYPEGFITSHIDVLENGLCVMTAKVGEYTAEGKALVLGTGTAYEKESNSGINKTSYIENCETSAVGRALGMAGFGIDTAIASAEELSNALNAQSEFVPKCQSCGKQITPKEHDWSIKHFKGQILCRNCQQALAKQNGNQTTV